MDDQSHFHPHPEGFDLLNDPVINKGSAFTVEERDKLKLRGLLPPRIVDIATQQTRVMENFHQKPTDLEKYIHMVGLQDRNETLFYRTVIDNIVEMMPIIYTPTVGQACREFGHIFRRHRGMYLSTDDRGEMRRLMDNWPYEAKIIVVTDGERILGLGDLGANGMGIPIGKLSLYTACAGVHPNVCLPITLDVGTNNGELLSDPLYIGLRRRRLRGEAYDSFVQEFIEAAQDKWPGVVIQFEDFATANAFQLLARYRDQICCFNDDIQGTAAVALSGLVKAGRITGKKLREGKFLFLGAGEAAVGIADLTLSSMISLGQSEEEARRRFWMMDSTGLVVAQRDNLPPHKVPYAHEGEFTSDLLEAIERLQPTALIGVSGQPQTFGESVVKAMARINERPIIFALSNPTSKSECTAEQAYRWSEGRAIFASGSPFPTFDYQGRTFVPGQGNNAYIFPGLGLGTITSGSTRISLKMIVAAARSLAQQTGDEALETGSLYPPLTEVREASLGIAVAVAEEAYEQGLATVPRPDDLREFIRAQVYEPVYSSLA